MRLDWLEDILAVAETGSFTEAAERRRLTQSAFSRRIQQIEDHVGVELFDRRSKPIRLRPTTESQRETIALLVGQLRQLVLDLRRGDKTSANRIIIASQHSLTAILAPSIIESAQARDPHTFVKVRSANLDECFSLLLSRQVDFALLYRNPGWQHPVRPDFVETVMIGTERLVPTIGAPHAAWVRDKIMEKDLPYIAYPAEVFFGEVMERNILSKLRDECQVVAKAETALTMAALEMAAAGFAVAWVPSSLAHARISDGTLVDLSDRLPSCDLEVTAIRLVDPSGERSEQPFWSQLTALAALA
ncbi:LysR family transcriptional regulator [Rhizobium mayense]|uniref:LysR family transcriptional regulator n=1 Tax=Rhizobium mayense TaxID=1312184 RepID=A0ABT7JRE3_9HYPH|nr:LysR family transcriptional regulator [Rhizobium mayense]MDL2398925.1 LysR family transcriptional regulator [Rhizobium mayense]